MRAIGARIRRLEQAQPHFRQDGRDPRLLALGRDVYGDAYCDSMVPIGLSFERWWEQVTAGSANHTIAVNHKLWSNEPEFAGRTQRMGVPANRRQAHAPRQRSGNPCWDLFLWRTREI